MQSLASPGCIFISGFIFDQMAGKLPFAYEDPGKQSVKNIDKPVCVYRLLENSDQLNRQHKTKTKRFYKAMVIRRYVFLLAVLLLALAGAFLARQWNGIFPKSAKVSATAELQVIAVLPFENLSQTAEFDNFTDALTDDIITNLSQLSGLAVMARNSVFIYKKRPAKIQALARELNAQFILECSLCRAGDQILMNVQLINAMQGFHIWA